MSQTLNPVHVRIRNFQSIEDLEFEVNGFTCITGRTNIGKSAIMRALSRSLLNDPVTGMVRKGTAFSSVEMHSEGWGFLWEKGEKNVNRYQIDGKTFDKTGQVQLAEIEAMGFRSIRIGDDDLEPWWAPQISSMFLLNKSGPQITNFISEVSRLQVYQNAIVLAARQKRKCTDEMRTKSEDLGRVQDKLNKLSGVQSVERLEAEIEDQIRSLQEYVQRALTLEELHRCLEAVAGRLQRTKDASEFRMKGSVAEVEEAVKKFASAARLQNRLQNCARKIIAFKAAEGLTVPSLPTEEVERLRKLSRCLKVVPLRAALARSEPAVKLKAPSLKAAEDAIAAIGRAYGMSVSIAKAAAVLGKLSDLPTVPKLPEEDVQRLRKLYVCSKRIQELRANVEAAEAEEKRLLALKKKVEKRLAAIQVCPECGQKLPEHTHAKGKKALSA